jgi:hypothetical protein
VLAPLPLEPEERAPPRDPVPPEPLDAPLAPALLDPLAPPVAWLEAEPPALPLADWALLEDPVEVPPPEAPVPSDEAAALGSPGEPEAPELLLLALDAGEDAAASLDFVGADGELEDV